MRGKGPSVLGMVCSCEASMHSNMHNSGDIVVIRYKTSHIDRGLDEKVETRVKQHETR